MTQASADRHHEALKGKHAALERAIHDEEGRPRPDEDSLRQLKARKLRLKEEMEGIQAHH